MAVVAIPLLIYPIVLISLCVFFILHILISIKKFGFLKTVKSKTTWVILVCIAICGTLHSLFFWGDSSPRSGNQLFEDYVRKPVPESVKVLDSFDGGADFYPDECLHFKISPADFQLILASKKWRVVSEAPMGGLQCDYKNAAWDFSFPPPSLGDNVITYTFIPREGHFEAMFSNSQMDEVYFFSHDGNLP